MFDRFADVDDECALDSDCQFDGALCQNARCELTATYKAEYEKLIIRKSERDIHNNYLLGVDCTSDNDCNDIEGAICSPLTKKCTCKRGYFYDSSSCIAGELNLNIKKQINVVDLK